MLFYLFSRDELGQILGRLGYDYHPDTAGRNVAYYDRRTSHGSTWQTLKLAAHPEIVSRPVRAGVPGDVRELRAGDRSVFELR